MDFITFFYIIVVSLIIVAATVYFLKRKKRMPYTHDSKKKQALTNIDKMLSNIKHQTIHTEFEVAQPLTEHINTSHTEHTEQIHHSTHNEVKHDEKKEHQPKKQDFDAKSAIIYSSIIQRKKPKH